MCELVPGAPATIVEPVTVIEPEMPTAAAKASELALVVGESSFCWVQTPAERVNTKATPPCRAGSRPPATIVAPEMATFRCEPATSAGSGCGRMLPAELVSCCCCVQRLASVRGVDVDDMRRVASLWVIVTVNLELVSAWSKPC